MRRARIGAGLIAALGLLWFTSPAPAYTIAAGLTLDLHQDVPCDPFLNNCPNDFHVEGMICTKTGSTPVLARHLDGPFLNFSSSVTYVGDCWWKFTADWWGLSPNWPGGIPYCTIIHLGLLFDIQDENTIIDLIGWWTRNGIPIGQIHGTLRNGGFTPVLGFDVTPFPVGPPPSGSAARIGNGIIEPIGKPIPLPPPGPMPIELRVTELDVVAFEREALPPGWFDELREGGMQEMWDWVPVLHASGEDVAPARPLYMVPDSFFDVFLEIAGGGGGGGAIHTAWPVTVPANGLLFIRSKRQFVNNAGQLEPGDGIWEWHIHQAQGPEACCFDDGSCLVMTPPDCLARGGFPQGPNTVCDPNPCPQPPKEPCCWLDGSCSYVPLGLCIPMGGRPPQAGACLGDLNGNQIDDGCEDPIEPCCWPDGSCTYVAPGTCIPRGGTLSPVGACLGDLNGNGVDDGCEQPPTEPCCWLDGSCSYVPLGMCIPMGGRPPQAGACLGDLNGNQIDDGCEDPIEPCCWPDGSCTYVAPGTCIPLGGKLPPAGACLGDLNGNQIDDGCEDPIEPCCWPDGSCTYVAPGTCLPRGGTHPPAGACLGDLNGNQIDDGCEPQTEPCCWPDDSCSYVAPGTCGPMGGTVAPAGACLGDLNGNQIDDGCEQQIEACCWPDGTCTYVAPGTCVLLGGKLALAGACLGDANGNGIDDGCEEMPPFQIEFSLDIGSDKEMSDPQMDGDEAFDPGDVYLWRSAPVLPPGRNGFKDDAQRIFGQDPPPIPGVPPSRVPVGTGLPPSAWPQFYPAYFDLDGHDQLDFETMEFVNPNAPLTQPVPRFPSVCVYEARYLMVSFDDDRRPGWIWTPPPMGDVPVSVPSPTGAIYGTTPNQNEVVGVSLPMGVPPLPVAVAYPFADEVSVHQSLAPNPDVGDPEDDDVDSLDIVRAEGACPFYYFTVDYEANMGLDPGHIYLALNGLMPPAKVIDRTIHLGLPAGTDIDGFEFVWINLPMTPGPQVLAIVFSVDDDDPVTPLVDESGGLDPRMIYWSTFQGWSNPLLKAPLPDDIDAITAWEKNLGPPLLVISSVSRKVHGTSGTFDVASGGWEGRVPNTSVQGPSTIVTKFNQAVQRVTGTNADVSVSSGTVAGISVSGDELTVTLTGIANRATFTIGYPGIAAAADLSLVTGQTDCWQVLAGEASGPAGTPPVIVVNTSDFVYVRGRIGQVLSAGNFRADVNADGAINTSDFVAIRGRIDSLFSMKPYCP